MFNYSREDVSKILIITEYPLQHRGLTAIKADFPGVDNVLNFLQEKQRVNGHSINHHINGMRFLQEVFTSDLDFP